MKRTRPYKLLLVAGILLAVFFFARLATAQRVPDARYASYRVSVREGSSMSSGSGTGIAPSLVLTNSHVVGHKTGHTATLRGPGGDFEGRVIAADRNCDLAFISINGGRTIPYAPLDFSDPTGKRITRVVYGREAKQRTISCQVVDHYVGGKGREVPMLELSVPSENGDSGGGCFTVKGLTATLWGSDNRTTVATPAREIIWLAQKWDAEHGGSLRGGTILQHFPGIPTSWKVPSRFRPVSSQFSHLKRIPSRFKPCGPFRCRIVQQPVFCSPYYGGGGRIVYTSPPRIIQANQPPANNGRIGGSYWYGGGIVAASQNPQTSAPAAQSAAPAQTMVTQETLNQAIAGYQAAVQAEGVTAAELVKAQAALLAAQVAYQASQTKHQGARKLTEAAKGVVDSAHSLRKP